MEITFKIDGATIGESFTETFDSLNREDKRTIAKEVFLEWLRRPEDYEWMQQEEEALKELRDEWSLRNKSDDEIRKSHKYDMMKKEFRTTKDKMADRIVENISELHDKVLTDHVKNDPEIQSIIEEAVEQFDEELPGLIQKYMAQHLASAFMNHLDNMRNDTFNAMVSLDEIKSRLSTL